MVLSARCKKICRKVWNRVGFRGSFLFLLGWYDLWYGMYLAVGGATQHPFSLGNHTWGLIWIATALFLFTGVPAKRDRWQFGWAVFIKIAWALEYLVLANVVPWDWIRSLYWGAFGLIILLVSAWPEPQKYENVTEVITRARNGHEI